MSETNNKFIQIENIEQTFKTKKGLFPALRDVNLTIAFCNLGLGEIG